jgi:Gamma-glutamyltranspeptidase
MQGIPRFWLAHKPLYRSFVRLVATLLLILAVVGIAQPASSAPTAETPKQPTATGTGGAVATVDHDASKVGMQVLKGGGNAVDAAVATAAALGVTEPYSCGIGGGGFMVVYRASDRSISTIDSRETAPAAFQPDSFIDPKTGQPIPFEERVTSGLGVGYLARSGAGSGRSTGSAPGPSPSSCSPPSSSPPAALSWIRPTASRLWTTSTASGPLPRRARRS